MGEELGPHWAAVSEVERDLRGDQIAPFRVRRGGPVSGYPAGVRTSSTLWGLGDTWRAFRWSMRVQGLRAGAVASGSPPAAEATDST